MDRQVALVMLLPTTLQILFIFRVHNKSVKMRILG